MIKNIRRKKIFLLQLFTSLGCYKKVLSQTLQHRCYGHPYDTRGPPCSSFSSGDSALQLFSFPPSHMIRICLRSQQQRTLSFMHVYSTFFLSSQLGNHSLGPIVPDTLVGTPNTPPAFFALVNCIQHWHLFELAVLQH